MKFILLLFALPLASATLSDCEKDFLNKCRTCATPISPSSETHCPEVGFDCDPVDPLDLAKFNNSNGQFNRDCARLTCVDPNAELHVEGVPYKMLACASGAWHYGKHFTLVTDSAACFKKCTTCNKNLPAGINEGVTRAEKSVKVTPIDPVIGVPCTTAECVDVGFTMWGVKAEDGEHEAIEEIPACNGDRIWFAGGIKYTALYCKPPPTE